MSETIGPLAAGRRRRPSTMRRATAPVRTPSVTFTASAASCRPMPTAAITDFTTPAVRRARLRRHCVGRMHAGSSLSSPTSPPIRGSASVAEPIDYMLRRWPSFARFLDDGRICLSNNAAERALRGFALGRRSWLFAGSERGADRAAAIATLIMTAKLNDVDPQAWLADVLARIAEHPTQRLEELLPWRWAVLTRVDQAA